MTEPAEHLEPEESESLPAFIDLGGGIRLMIAPDAFAKIMHAESTIAAVDARGQAIADAANANAVTQDARYTYKPSTTPDTNHRARGRVQPANWAARKDNARHSTLLKALAGVGSDPLPEYGAPTHDDDDAGPDQHAAPAPAEETETEE